MNPRVISAKPSENYFIKLEFSNGEKGVFDTKPYLQKGVFVALQDKKYFEKLQVFNGTVVWGNELDFCPDTLYLESKPVQFTA